MNYIFSLNPRYILSSVTVKESVLNIYFIPLKNYAYLKTFQFIDFKTDLIMFFVSENLAFGISLDSSNFIIIIIPKTVCIARLFFSILLCDY